MSIAKIRNILSMPVQNGEVKHILHVVCFIVFILCFCLLAGIFWSLPRDLIDPWLEYGLFGSALLYLLRVLSLLALPQCAFNTLGLILYNAFRDQVPLKGSPLLAPFICIRVVTKGDYPDLVKNNVQLNIDTCRKVGLENFLIEVVSDKAIDLPKNPRVREIVVPQTYATKSGALFKARALQYCWEDEVNLLDDSDWIVHLDEETLLSENSVRGVLNFCADGEHPFGQGVVTYAHGPIVNWATTLADSFRVADDLGKLRYQLYGFHKPLFGWKGSFVVARAQDERRVSYDHGPDGSVAEDCFFAMVAYRDGYSFNFIEGQMHEKSPFTIWDFLQQRKRWLQGIYLVVCSPKIPFKNKVLLMIMFYAWVALPFTICNAALAPLYPLPCHFLLDLGVAYVGAVNLYMYVFGTVKSFGHWYRKRPWRFLICVLCSLLVIPFNAGLESVAVLWGLIGRKHQFYIVHKESVAFNV